MEISRIDPYDDAALAAWHAATDEGARHGRTDAPIWTLPEITVSLRPEGSERAWSREPFVAVEAGQVLGAGMIEWTLKDNPTHGEIDVAVPPANRGRGVGGALFTFGMARLAELGRTSIETAVNQPVNAPEVPGVAFAAHRGFSRRNIEMRRQLKLPVPADLLDSLNAKALQASGAYTLKTWRDTCPDEFVEQYAHLKSLLSSQAPLGELDYEPEVWDVARLRAEEDTAAKQNRTTLTAVVVAPDGSLAGHTQLAVPGHEAGKAFQWDTLVLPEHRGHRLGLLLKVSNLRILQDEFPDRDRVETWNAQQNGPMNAVNDALGFYSLEEFQGWQLDTTDTSKS